MHLLHLLPSHCFDVSWVPFSWAWFHLNHRPQRVYFQLLIRLVLNIFIRFLSFGLLACFQNVHVFGLSKSLFRWYLPSILIFLFYLITHTSPSTRSIPGMSLLVSCRLTNCFSSDAWSSSHRSWPLLNCCSSECDVILSEIPSTHCSHCLISLSYRYLLLFLRPHRYHS